MRRSLAGSSFFPHCLFSGLAARRQREVKIQFSGTCSDHAELNSKVQRALELVVTSSSSWRRLRLTYVVEILLLPTEQRKAIKMAVMEV